MNPTQSVCTDMRVFAARATSVPLLALMLSLNCTSTQHTYDT